MCDVLASLMTAAMRVTLLCGGAAVLLSVLMLFLGLLPVRFCLPAMSLL